MKRWNAILSILCGVLVLTMNGCGASPAAASESGTSSSEVSSNFGVSSLNEESVVSMLSSSTPAVSGLKAEEFLNSADGQKVRTLAIKFTEAYFGGDVSTMKSCLIDPESKINKFNTENKPQNVELLNLKLYPEEIKDSSVHAQYEVQIKGDVGYSYLDLQMKKVSNDWKVDSFGLEK